MIKLPKHASSFVKDTAGNEELFRFLTWGPFANEHEFEEWYQERVGSKKGTVLFAVFVNHLEKTEGRREGEEQQGRFAGIIGLEYTNTSYATTEIGLVGLSSLSRCWIVCFCYLQFLFSVPKI
jgi:hypothetical protein